MSTGFLMGTGGGSGLLPTNAVIHVTSDAGSTITFEKGGVVVKVLGPDKQHINSADPLVAEWYLPVSPGNYGEWKVTASRDNDSGFETVTVSANKQYDVKIRYILMIFKEGTGLMNGFTVVSAGNGGSFNVNATRIYQESGESGWSGFTIKPAIPHIEQYKKIQFIHKTGNSAYGGGTLTVGISTSATGTGFNASFAAGGGGAKVTSTLNIASFTSGTYYIKTFRNNGPQGEQFFDIRLLRE